jgi:hypothetical protein
MRSERQVARQEADRYEKMMREKAQEYCGSPQNQEE